MKIILFAALSLLFAVPLSAEAIEIVPTTLHSTALKELAAGQGKNSESFCANFSETSRMLSEKISEKRGAVTDFLSEKNQNQADSRNQRDAKLNEARSEADQKRSSWYAVLLNRARTDDEKKAVENFEKVTDAAVTDRRAAVDSAIESFREAVDAGIAARKESMKTESGAFQSAFEATLQSVSGDCNRGLATAVIRENFRNRLAADRAKLATDKKSVETLGKDIHSLAALRNVSVKKAMDTYQAAITAALKDLKNALGEDAL